MNTSFSWVSPLPLRKEDDTSSSARCSGRRSKSIGGPIPEQPAPRSAVAPQRPSLTRALWSSFRLSSSSSSSPSWVPLSDNDEKECHGKSTYLKLTRKPQEAVKRSLSFHKKKRTNRTLGEQAPLGYQVHAKGVATPPHRRCGIAAPLRSHRCSNTMEITNIVTGTLNDTEDGGGGGSDEDKSFSTCSSLEKSDMESWSLPPCRSTNTIKKPKMNLPGVDAEGKGEDASSPNKPFILQTAPSCGHSVVSWDYDCAEQEDNHPTFCDMDDHSLVDTFEKVDDTMDDSHEESSMSSFCRRRRRLSSCSLSIMAADQIMEGSSEANPPPSSCAVSYPTAHSHGTPEVVASHKGDEHDSDDLEKKIELWTPTTATGGRTSTTKTLSSKSTPQTSGVASKTTREFTLPTPPPPPPLVWITCLPDANRGGHLEHLQRHHNKKNDNNNAQQTENETDDKRDDLVVSYDTITYDENRVEI